MTVGHPYPHAARPACAPRDKHEKNARLRKLSLAALLANPVCGLAFPAEARADVGPALESIRGKPVNERRLEVSLLDMNADTRECAMLFIAAPAERHIERITALSRGTGMLTIGDTQGFAQRGAMVNFFSQDGKIRFEINLDAARHGGLKISSKLLSLARIVDSGIVDSGITH